MAGWRTDKDVIDVSRGDGSASSHNPQEVAGAKYKLIDAGGNTIIQFNSSDRLTLLHVHVGDITSADFIG
jgi:hypothetical protein